MSDVRLYFRLISISIQAQMQYRASFAMYSVANFLMTAIEFVGAAALFGRFGNLNGWRLPEVAVLYGVIHTAFALAEAAGRGFDVLHRHVRAGTFDRMLLRPRSTVLQVLGQDFQLLRVGRLAQGLMVLFWGAGSAGLAWTPARALLLCAAVLGGMLLLCGLFVLQATMSFWTVEGLEIANVLTNGGVEAAQWPMDIYRNWLRGFLIFVVPLATVNYFPVLGLLGKSASLGHPPYLAWLSPAVGLAFFGISLRIWGFGVRHYHSTGS